jgi:hypothetical protein
MAIIIIFLEVEVRLLTHQLGQQMVELVAVGEEWVIQLLVLELLVGLLYRLMPIFMVELTQEEGQVEQHGTTLRDQMVEVGA